MNTSAAVKAEAAICCTSGNARAGIKSTPAAREVLFLPDLFLGPWLAKLRNAFRDMGHQVIVPPDVAERARLALSRMVALG